MTQLIVGNYVVALPNGAARLEFKGAHVEVQDESGTCLRDYQIQLRATASRSFRDQLLDMLDGDRELMVVIDGYLKEREEALLKQIVEGISSGRYCFHGARHITDWPDGRQP